MKRRYHFHIWFKVIDEERRGEFRNTIMSTRKVFTPALIREAEGLIEQQGNYGEGSVIVTNYKLVNS